jgi:HEAT repeat protein
LFYKYQPEDHDTDRRAYWELGKSFDNRLEEEKNTGKKEEIERSAAEARRYVELPLCRTPLADPPDGYTRIEMTSFLLRHAVPCSWLPTVNDLIKQLNEDDWDEKVTASTFLKQMGPHASKAEATALKYLLIQGMSRSGEIRANCAAILGNIGTTNPAAIRTLILAAGDFDHPVKDAAIQSLHRLGPKAVPYIIEYLQSSRMVRDTRFRLPLVEVLGKLGSDARSALPVLQHIVNTDRDTYVGERAKIAIININEGRREEPR